MCANGFQRNADLQRGQGFDNLLQKSLKKQLPYLQTSLLYPFIESSLHNLLNTADIAHQMKKIAS